MRAAPVTGLAANSRYHFTLVVFVEAKVFFIDFSRHGIHMAGHVFFRFGVAGKVQVVVRAVGIWGMTKITFNAQGGLPAIHRAVQLVMADILWQNLQIFFWRFVILGGSDG